MPATFGEVATFINKLASLHAATVHILCDNTLMSQPSRTSNVIGEEMLKLHTPFKDAIKPVQQIWIVHFYLRRSSPHWLTSLPTKLGHSITKKKTVFFAWEQSCMKVQVDNNEEIISVVDELSCSQNEADTRILWHARYAAKNSNPHIVVRASDTGICIFLFHCAFQLDAQIWMDTGSSSLNTKWILIFQAWQMVRSNCTCCMCHITGSDYRASFMRKGCPFDVMIKNEESPHTFTRLGQSDIVSSEVSTTLECSAIQNILQKVCSTYWWETIGENNIRWPILFATLQSHTAAEDKALQLRSSVLEKLNSGQNAWCVTSWSMMGTWWRNFKHYMVWRTTYTSTCSEWLIRRGYQYWRWKDPPGIIR